MRPEDIVHALDDRLVRLPSLLPESLDNGHVGRRERLTGRGLVEHSGERRIPIRGRHVALGATVHALRIRWRREVHDGSAGAGRLVEALRERRIGGWRDARRNTPKHVSKGRGGKRILRGSAGERTGRPDSRRGDRSRGHLVRGHLGAGQGSLGAVECMSPDFAEFGRALLDLAETGSCGRITVGEIGGALRGGRRLHGAVLEPLRDADGVGVIGVGDAAPVDRRCEFVVEHRLDGVAPSARTIRHAVERDLPNGGHPFVAFTASLGEHDAGEPISLRGDGRRAYSERIPGVVRIAGKRVLGRCHLCAGRRACDGRQNGSRRLRPDLAVSRQTVLRLETPDAIRAGIAPAGEQALRAPVFVEAIRAGTLVVVPVRTFAFDRRDAVRHDAADKIEVSVVLAAEVDAHAALNADPPIGERRERGPRHDGAVRGDDAEITSNAPAALVMALATGAARAGLGAAVHDRCISGAVRLLDARLHGVDEVGTDGAVPGGAGIGDDDLGARPQSGRWRIRVGLAEPRCTLARRPHDPRLRHRRIPRSPPPTLRHLSKCVEKQFLLLRLDLGNLGLPLLRGEVAVSLDLPLLLPQLV